MPVFTESILIEYFHRRRCTLSYLVQRRAETVLTARLQRILNDTLNFPLRSNLKRSAEATSRVKKLCLDQQASQWPSRCSALGFCCNNKYYIWPTQTKGISGPGSGSDASSNLVNPVIVAPQPEDQESCSQVRETTLFLIRRCWRVESGSNSTWAQRCQK